MAAAVYTLFGMHATTTSIALVAAVSEQVLTLTASAHTVQVVVDVLYP